MKPVSLPQFNTTWQHQQFASLKANRPSKWLLMIMDFGENLTCHYQDEVQGVHWARLQVTIHPVVAYYHCPLDDEVSRESFMILSNDLKHDAYAVQYFQLQVTRELLRRGLNFERIVHFSDGCAGQYKGRTNFADLSFAIEDTGILTEKHCFGSRHGKGPCDAEIGVLKRCANLAVRRRSTVIANAEDLFLYGKSSLTRPAPGEPHSHSRRTFLLICQEEIKRERPERTGLNIRTLPGMRTAHCLRNVAPFVITRRTRSCFCRACVTLEGQCTNDNFCGPWTVFRMTKRGKLQI